MDSGEVAQNNFWLLNSGMVWWLGTQSLLNWLPVYLLETTMSFGGV